MLRKLKTEFNEKWFEMSPSLQRLFITDLLIVLIGLFTLTSFLLGILLVTR